MLWVLYIWNTPQEVVHGIIDISTNRVSFALSFHTISVAIVKTTAMRVDHKSIRQAF